MQAALNKTYNISLTLKMTRGPGEIEIAKDELERLHKLLTSEQSTQFTWAREQIEKVTRMVLLPNVDDIRQDLSKKLREADEDHEPLKS